MTGSLNALVAVWAGALALVAAALAVTRPGAVHALLYLVASLLGLAAACFALGAPFAGVLLVLVYVGAIVVVFVFIVMTLDPGPAAGAGQRTALARAWPVPAAIAALVVAPFLLGGVGGVGAGPDPASGAAPMAVSAKAVGQLLVGPWALAVELASMLLLVGLIGVRHLARRERELEPAFKDPP